MPPSTGSGSGSKPARSIPAVVRFYLVVYNLASFAAWSYVLFLTVNELFVLKTPYAELYSRVGRVLAITQSLAIAEIVHSLIGIVPSPVATVAMQVSSRLLLVWGITEPVSESRLHWGYAMMVLSWSVVEIPRYAYYAWNLIAPTSIPFALTYLRYSLFMILYPTGISGELSCIYQSLASVQRSGLYSLALPNAWNFSFNYYYALLVILLLYVPGSPVMYGHMLHQRKKNINPAAAGEKKRH